MSHELQRQHLPWTFSLTQHQRGPRRPRQIRLCFTTELVQVSRVVLQLSLGWFRPFVLVGATFKISIQQLPSPEWKALIFYPKMTFPG